jgi:GNAT superfamily N-acetyltransferase
LRIESITERANLIEAVARWQHDEWGHREPGNALAARIADLDRQAASPCRIPRTFVALDGDEPLGCASVVQEDAETFRASPRQRGLTPWLASVYVRPEARGRGVATALVRRVMEHVAAMGVARLYLFTEGARGLYEKIGWEVIGTDRHEGVTMTIMAVDLAPDATFLGGR